MINRLRLKNFQSWKALDMPLAPITMLVGAGNSGKTAIYRAITAALQNNGGDEGIRHEADKAKVMLDMEDRSLLWEKARGVGAVYHTSIDDKVQDYTKTGQTTPEEIVDAFGFRPVELDKNLSIWPQFKDQWDRPFLVFESGSRTAKVLGKLTKLDVFVRAQMNARRALDAAQAEARTALEEAERRHEELAALPDLDAIRREYDRLTDTAERAAGRHATATKARASLQSAAEAERTLRGDSPEQAIAAHEEAAQAVAHYERAERLVREHRQLVSNLRAAEDVLDAATRGHEELANEYHNACETEGICETCPWR